MTKKKRGKLVWVTGISGCGRKGHLEKWHMVECKKRGKNVLVYQIGQMIFEQAKKEGIYLNPINVLNADPDVLSALRGAVFEKILGRLNDDLKLYDAIILNAHSYFFWEECFMRAYNSAYIDEFSPDLFISFIDHDEFILKRMSARAQWKNQRLTSQKILYWQNLEVESTKAQAEVFHKKFFAIPVKQPEITLYYLLFEPWREPIYFNVPMTYLRPEELKTVGRFVSRLWKCPFIVFNPFTVETGIIKPGLSEVEVTRHRQTIHRDLRWFLGQCKKSVAFFPRVVSSPGVFHETFTSFMSTKDPWIIHPPPFSPFLVGRTTRDPFPNQRSFFKFLEKEYIPLRIKKWKEEHGETEWGN